MGQARTLRDRGIPEGASSLSNSHANFIWSVADLLGGSFKAYQYGGIIRPFRALPKSPDAAQIAAVVLAMGPYDRARSAAESEP